MASTLPPKPAEVRPNVRPVIGPDPVAGLLKVFEQIDQYKRAERERFAQQLAAIGKAEGDGEQAQEAEAEESLDRTRNP
jgi:hypothetical protein